MELEQLTSQQEINMPHRSSSPQPTGSKHQHCSLHVQWRGFSNEQSPASEGRAVTRTRPPAPLFHFLLLKGRASAATQEELWGAGLSPGGPARSGHGLCRPRATSRSDRAARRVSAPPNCHAPQAWCEHIYKEARPAAAEPRAG